MMTSKALKYLNLCILACVALTAFVFVPLSRAEESYLLLSASPQAGKTVRPGDFIQYQVLIGPKGQNDKLAALRVQLGQGMRVMENSIKVIQALPQNTGAPGSTPASEASPTPSELPPAEADIVIGSDGFIVVLPSLHPGDVITFDATIEAQDAVAEMTAIFSSLDNSISHSSSLLHVLDMPASPVPEPTLAVPIEIPEVDDTYEKAVVRLMEVRRLWWWLLFAVCLVGLYLDLQFLSFQFKLRKHWRVMEENKEKLHRIQAGLVTTIQISDAQIASEIIQEANRMKPLS